MLDEIEVGADLTPRLSTGVETAYVPKAERKTPGAANRDIDTMLAHDGLHHLHLGEDTNRSFVERTGDLLFIAFTDDEACHWRLSPRRLGASGVFERIVRNWPKADLLSV